MAKHCAKPQRFRPSWIGLDARPFISAVPGSGSVFAKMSGNAVVRWATRSAVTAPARQVCGNTADWAAEIEPARVLVIFAPIFGKVLAGTGGAGCVPCDMDERKLAPGISKLLMLEQAPKG